MKTHLLGLLAVLLLVGGLVVLKCFDPELRKPVVKSNSFPVQGLRE